MVRTRLVLVIAAAALAGCVTPHVKPKTSQAVLDARAHRNAQAAAAAKACPQTPLPELSPLEAGFGFDEVVLDDTGARKLAVAEAWLACHPAVQVVIKPDADAHGTDAEQDAIARRRAEAVSSYLTGQGLPADRIRILPRTAAEPAAGPLVILAEGRRW